MWLTIDIDCMCSQHTKFQLYLIRDSKWNKYIAFNNKFYVTYNRPINLKLSRPISKKPSDVLDASVYYTNIQYVRGQINTEFLPRTTLDNRQVRLSKQAKSKTFFHSSRASMSF